MLQVVWFIKWSISTGLIINYLDSLCVKFTEQGQWIGFHRTMNTFESTVTGRPHANTLSLKVEALKWELKSVGYTAHTLNFGFPSEGTC